MNGKIKKIKNEKKKNKSKKDEKKQIICICGRRGWNNKLFMMFVVAWLLDAAEA